METSQYYLQLRAQVQREEQERAALEIKVLLGLVLLAIVLGAWIWFRRKRLAAAARSAALEGSAHALAATRRVTTAAVGVAANVRARADEIAAKRRAGD